MFTVAFAGGGKVGGVSAALRGFCDVELTSRNMRFAALTRQDVLPVRSVSRCVSLYNPEVSSAHHWPTYRERSHSTPPGRLQGSGTGHHDSTQAQTCHPLPSGFTVMNRTPMAGSDEGCIPMLGNCQGINSGGVFGSSTPPLPTPKKCK